jgi:diketogulonate reductase-like aldo/keto reductase
MELTLDTRLQLNNAVEMPIFGLGTYRSGRGIETLKAVLWALEAGYRHIDTAKIYGNERDVGKALRESSIPREDVFITTKLWNSDHGYISTITACQKSLEELDLDYVDLYLIHWPVPELRLETWKAMEQLLEEGKCRAIGVSNYTIWHLQELLESEYSNVVPAVNQVEFSPYLFQKDLLDFCQSKEIQVESYSPLTKGQKLNDPRLGEIAQKYEKTPAQLLIRWNLEHQIIVIPKSTKKERIYENADIFDFSITSTDMKTLDSLNENLRTGWDPSTVS